MAAREPPLARKIKWSGCVALEAGKGSGSPGFPRPSAHYPTFTVASARRSSFLPTHANLLRKFSTSHLNGEKNDFSR